MMYDVFVRITIVCDADRSSEEGYENDLRKEYTLQDMISMYDDYVSKPLRQLVSEMINSDMADLQEVLRENTSGIIETCHA